MKLRPFLTLTLALAAILLTATQSYAGPIRNFINNVREAREARHTPTTCETCRPASMPLQSIFSGNVLRTFAPMQVGQGDGLRASYYNGRVVTQGCTGPNCGR